MPREVRDEEAQTSGAAKKSGDGVHVAGVHISDLQLPLVGMFLSATVLLVAVLSYKLDIKWREYAISVPSITMALSFPGLLITCKEDFYRENGKYLNQFLFLWNFVGASILTFSSPFTTTGNGYFASWGMVICSAMALGMSATVFYSSVKGLGAKMGILTSSIIALIATAQHLGESQTFRNESIYIICVACFTIVILLGMLVKERTRADASEKTTVMFVVLAFNGILWVVAAFIGTFRGPFLITGNGYFACWAGATSSAMAALAARKDEN